MLIFCKCRKEIPLLIFMKMLLTLIVSTKGENNVLLLYQNTKGAQMKQPTEIGLILCVLHQNKLQF